MLTPVKDMAQILHAVRGYTGAEDDTLQSIAMSHHIDNNPAHDQVHDFGESQYGRDCMKQYYQTKAIAVSLWDE